MAYERQIEDFAESKATWVSYTPIPLLKTVQLVRGWKAVTDAEKSANETYLNAYVSPKNEVPSSTIEDPQADGSGTLEGGGLKNVFPGLWRHVSTAWSRENQIYLQTLRLGWATSLAGDECMIKTGSDQRDDARSYTFYWRNIASTAVDACVDGLRELGTLVNPVVQGEEKTGSFAIANIVPEQQDDGSYWISVQTLKVATVEKAADLDALSPIRKDVHDIENPFGLEGGYVEHIGRKPTDGIILTYRAISIGSRAALMALTDAEFQQRLSVEEQARYEFVKRELAEDSGNTLTLTLVYQYIPLAQTISEATARFVGVEYKNQSNKLILTISWPRMDPGVVADIMQNNALAIRDTAEDPEVEGKKYIGTFLVKTTVAPMTDNDGVRIVQTMTKTGDQKLDVITGKDPDHRIYEFYRWDISALYVSWFEDQIEDEAQGLPDLNGNRLTYRWKTPEEGRLKSIRITKNQDESFDLYAVFSDTADLAKVALCPAGITATMTGVVRAGVPLTVSDTYYRRSERAYGWNIPSIWLKTYSDFYDPAVAVANQRNTFQIQRQTEHVFDFTGTREFFTTIDSGWIVAIDDESKTISVRGGQFVLEGALAADQPFGVPSAKAASTVYGQKFQRNEVGSFDGQIVKTLYKDQEGSVYVRSAASDTDVETHTEGAEIVSPTAAAGTIRKVEQVPTEAGNFKTADTVITPKDQTGGVTIKSAASTTEVETHTENDKITNTAAAAGTIRKVEQVPTEAGNFKTADTVITPNDQLSAGGAVTKLERVTVEEHTEGETVAIPEAAVNVQVQVTEAPTEAGNLKTRKVTDTALPWDSSEVVVSDDGILAVKQKILKNQVEATAAGANQAADIQDNGRGAYNEVLRTRELSSGATGTKAVHKSSAVDWDVNKYNVKTITWKNSSSSDSEITGYDFWMISMSRSRTKTTTIIKSYSLTEPAALSVSVAEPGNSEGAGTSYSKDSKQVREGVWETVETTATTSAWSNWGNKTATWLYWIPVSDKAGGE